MLQTRNSKRLAQKRDAKSVKDKLLAKCEGTSLNQNVKESKRNLNRACKQILQREILKEKDKICNDINTKKKALVKSTSKSSVRLMDNKLKNNESKKIKEALNSKKNIKIDKENNLSQNQVPLPVPLKEISKTKTNSTRKITNYFPLKIISDNAVSHVPIWAVGKNLPQKQTKKRFRASDIYNIEKDEDLMNESPVKMKKITTVKKPRTIKNKVFSKKNISSHNSQKDKFLSVKAAKPAGQFTKYERLTGSPNKIEGIQTNVTKPLHHPMLKYGTSRSNFILEPIVPVPEPDDSVLEHVSSNAMKSVKIPVAVNEIATANNVDIQEENGGYVDCINDCYSSFANIDTSYISLRHSVAKCLGESANDNMSPEKHSTQGQNKTNNSVEDCINECYSSFINLDTSLREYVGKDIANLTREDKTPEKSLSIHKTNSEIVKISDNSHDIQLFLIPKMTSTPENGNQPIKQLSNNCGLKLSEMSAIPCTVSRNIQFELSEYEISPIKCASDKQKTSLFGFQSKDNQSHKDEICLSEKTISTSNFKEITAMKVHERNPTVKCSKIPKLSEKKICVETKCKLKDAEILLQKENIENAIFPKVGHKRKGPMFPLKPIQVDSVNNKIPLNDAKNQVFPLHKDNKNLGKTCPKHKSKKVATSIVDNIIGSSDKNSSEKNDFNIHQLGLFESPEREEMGIEKSHVKKKRKNIYTEKTASLLTKDDDLISVLKPVHCYQSPHQSKKFKSRKKTAPDGHGKIECDEKVDCQPKKQVSRTKKVHEVKQKAKEENEAEIEKLNEHFSELEKMDLCIE